MKLVTDALFDAQMTRFRLKLYCDDCVLFDPALLTETGGCAHGYPTDPHRAPTADAPRDWVFFCKDFEAM